MLADAPGRRAAAMGVAARGDLAGAMDLLRPLAEATDDPEDRFALGTMAFLHADWEDSRWQLERAYRAFRDQGLTRRAAMAAAMLGRLFVDGLEELVVGRGWLTRARRLLEHEDPCVEQGYALLGLMGASVANAEDLLTDAATALDLARRFHDPNLECRALGDSGLALVSLGRVEEGMARLDEAFTMIASGECGDPSAVSVTFCSLLTACDRCGDVPRAEAWLGAVERVAGRRREGPAVHLLAHCWSAFGSVLCQVGRWSEAETALRMGLARAESSFGQTRLASRAALADLWIRQGRLDEAARLIDQPGDRVEAMGPRARLALARGRSDLAAAVARQALRLLGGDVLRSAPLVLTLVRAEIGHGRLDAAGEAAARLGDLGERAAVPVVSAQAELALGIVAAARGDRDAAAGHFERGLEALPRDAWPLVRAELYLELARAQGDVAPAEVVVNAEAAFGIYERVGAPEAAAAAAFLHEQGVDVRAAPPPPGALALLSRREREVLELLAQGMPNAEIGTRLFITTKTAEHHVTSILRKLGLRNRTQAAAFAASFGVSPSNEALAAR